MLSKQEFESQSYGVGDIEVLVSKLHLLFSISRPLIFNIRFNNITYWAFGQ